MPDLSSCFIYLCNHYGFKFAILILCNIGFVLLEHRHNAKHVKLIVEMNDRIVKAKDKEIERMGSRLKQLENIFLDKRLSSKEFEGIF